MRQGGDGSRNVLPNLVPPRANRSPVAPSRRRAMAILGAVAGVPLLCAGDRPADAVPLCQWNGTSLGSPSRLLVYHSDRAAAARIVGQCAAEIARLERVFALYLADSEIARLNRDGRCDSPSLDLLTVLSRCRHLSELSGGAFDVTVQPLWDLYAAHFFGRASPAPDGPEPHAIQRARTLVDWRGIDVTARRIALARPRMGLTLNGIAQGYVTDRVTEILRDNGCDRILANMGCSELRTIGRHADGRPWRVGLADPRRPENVVATLDLCDRALCTSGGYGTKFEPTGRFHHLFDPDTGASADHYIAVSVFAASAMIADALSTTLYVMPPERGPLLLEHFPDVRALVTRPDGSVRHLPG
jgi:FAD:protein FMN transferase